MITEAEMSEALKLWAEEFESISKQKVIPLPENCREFIARRIIESLGSEDERTQSEPDVVKFRSNFEADAWTSYRIVGMSHNDMVQVTSTDDTPVMLLLPITDVHPDDAQKAKDWLWKVAPAE